ncbi:PR domain Zinc finger protein 14 [Plakobranchus ocellatus]|uniref:PR domain Zinc finger protein 14 n=1 Tax=Plakobranchus ocellatus TaxID=259542 RepID=A0AAV3Z791_9GAST|nr:PR domain Zinc finger protein 14 [Plakobranchus ocellatus]
MAESSESLPDFSSQEINTVELPSCIDIKESLVHKGEAGAFAKSLIRKDTRFGPYKGEIINPGQKDYVDYRYAWEVLKKRSKALKFTISALDPKVSNWMRHVNSARFYEEQNILSIQDGFSIFYVAMKDIQEGEELLTWFDPKLLRKSQRRLVKPERRAIGYTIELVPWSDEKKFTPEIIDTKRSRKKKVLSDMISLDEDPMAMTRTLQRLPKIPCTPRQLGNMAYPLANTLKKRKKLNQSRPQDSQRTSSHKKKPELKRVPEKSLQPSSNGAMSSGSDTSHSKLDLPGDDKSMQAKLELLPPHENLKEVLQAAQERPQIFPDALKVSNQIPQREAQVAQSISSTSDFLIHTGGKVKKKRGRKRLSDAPLRRRRRPISSFKGDFYGQTILPVSIKSKVDGSTIVDDHDESYTLTGVSLKSECDDLCPCLDKSKAMLDNVEPPCAANNYAMRFRLLPEHRRTENSKIVYRCDVCDGPYNHAFSLKRHYLSVHINHRYLTRDDIINCQIETFHKGIEVTERKNPLQAAPASQSTVPLPTFVAVNVANLIPPLSPVKKVLPEVKQQQLDQLSIKLQCNEDIGDHTECPGKTASRATERTKSVPSLSALAQACIRETKAQDKANVAKENSHSQTQMSLKCEENLASGLVAVTKAETSGGNDHMNLSSWADLKEKTEMLQASITNRAQGNHSNQSMNREIETNESRKSSEDGSGKSSKPSLVHDESDVKVKFKEESCQNSSSHSEENSSHTCPLYSSSSIPETENLELENGKDQVSEKSRSYMDNKCTVSTNNTARKSCSDLDEDALSRTNEIQKPEKDILMAEKAPSKTGDGDCVAVGTVREHINELDSNLQNAKLANDVDKLSQARSDEAYDCKDETDSLASPATNSTNIGNEISRGDIVDAGKDSSSASLASPATNSTNIGYETSHSDIADAGKDSSSCVTDSQKPSKAPENNNPSNNQVLSNSAHSDNEQKIASTAPAKSEKDDVPLSESIPAVSATSASSLSDSMVAPNPSLKQQKSASLTSPALTPKSTQAPVIFLTNIVIPVGSSGALGPSIIPQPRPAVSGAATIQTTSASPLAVSSLPSPSSLGKPLNPGTRLAAPRAPVPLVFISQVPPGVDPRNATNAFLKTSTAIKSLQNLQNSLTVAAMGNLNSQLSASNLPCFIGPLPQTANVAAVKGPLLSASGFAVPTSVTQLFTSTLSKTSSTISSSVAGSSSSLCSVNATALRVQQTSLSSTSPSASSFLDHRKPTASLSNMAQTSSSSSVISTLPVPKALSKSSQVSVLNQPQDLFRCHMCVLVFQTMQQLKHHIRHDPHRFKGGIKQYACIQCNMRFSNKNNLHRHNLMNHSETEDFKFRCFTCGKGFSSETYLKMHARFHLGKSFPCKYGCKDLYFPNAATLVKHLRKEHAGLDLKEYKRIHKMRRPAPKRNKINQILGATSSESIPVPTAAPPHGDQAKSSISYVHSSGDQPQKDSQGPSISVLPGRPQQGPSYSLLHPGVGFQAKRGRPKGSKNSVKTVHPLFQKPLPPPSLPLTVEIPPPAPVVAQPQKPKRKGRRARFVCKLCPKKFTTHLKLLRHRTRKHGMDQSVQEYLHMMSKDRDCGNSEPDDFVYSPPASPKTFFSNVCKRGFENFTQYIDGGGESLKSPIRKYINIKDYTSISEPFVPGPDEETKLEWTSYNFPPCFKYKYDSTTFYDAENSPSLEVLASKPLVDEKIEDFCKKECDSAQGNENDQKTEDVSEKECYSTEEYEPAQSIKLEPLDSDQLTLGDEQSKVEEEDNFVASLPELNANINSKEKNSAIDFVCDIGSKERGKQVIKSLARHLSRPELLEEESDLGELSQEDDGIECKEEDIEDIKYEKTGCLDETADDATEESPGVDKDIKVDNMLRTGKKRENLLTSNLVPKGSIENVGSDTQSGSDSPSLVHDNLPPTGTDSGLSSLSSCTLESFDDMKPSLNGSLEDPRKTPTMVLSSSEMREKFDGSAKLSVAASQVDNADLPPDKHKLPLISAEEKSDLMKRLTFQGINIDVSFGPVNKKQLVPSFGSCRSLNALDLFVPDDLLSPDRLTHISNPVKIRQVNDAKLGSKHMRHRTSSLPSLGENVMSLNTSDMSKHHEHRRLSLWAGHLPQKALDVPGQETYHYCPIVNIIGKQEALRELKSYEEAKANGEKTVNRRRFPANKLAFLGNTGLVPRAEFEMSPQAKRRDVYTIKPPEVWNNYENIWFGKRGTIVVVCSICHRHFSYWDLCLKHQLKKHPHIEPNILQMEKGNYVDDMYYYYPMKFGILAQTEPIPSNLPLPELFVCTRCGFPFRNLNRLHAHIVSCDPSLDGRASYRLPQAKKKLIPMMDRRLSQLDPAVAPVKPKLGRPFKRPDLTVNFNVSTAGSSEKSTFASQSSLPDSSKTLDQKPVCSMYRKPTGFSSSFSFYHGKKRKNYELLYNPQNHMRRRESYQVLDTHQCHGCNLKFKSMSLLERHVKKCSGRDRLQSQKPLLSGIMPDDAAVRKQHTCRYCNKRFTYIKGVDLHYKRICSVRKVKEEEGQLTPEDLAHEDELKRIIEHLKWSKTLNKDSSDIIQGNVRVEEDGSLTRVVKRRGCPAGVKKRVKKRKVKNKRWTYMKNHRHANKSAPESVENSQQKSPKLQAEVMSSVKQQSIDKPVQGYFGFQKKRSSPANDAASPAKRSCLSGNSSSSMDSTIDTPGPMALRSGGKRGRPKKCVTEGARSLRSKVKQDETMPGDSQILGSTSSAADDNDNNKPQSRKRGRPKKFDPSDMESSYKKKKKSDPDFVHRELEALKEDAHTGPSKTATKIGPEQDSNMSVSTRQQRAKMPTAAVRDDFVYEAPGVRRKPAPSRTRSRSSQSQLGKDKTKSSEDFPLPEQDLMEKMRELKKAALVESDKYKQQLSNRKEQRKARLKAMEKREEGSTAKQTQDTFDKGSKKTTSIPSSVPSANSTELFKHLTEDIPLVSTLKGVSSPIENPNRQALAVATSSSLDACESKAVSVKSLSRSSTASSRPSVNTSMLTADKPSNLEPSNNTSAATEEERSKKGKKVRPQTSQQDTSDQKKNITKDSKGYSVTGSAESKSARSSVTQLVLKSPPKSDSPKNPRGNTSEKDLSFTSLPKCSVRVVTLSPNRKNLLTFESPSKSNISSSTKQKVQTSPLPREGSCEKWDALPASEQLEGGKNVKPHCGQISSKTKDSDSQAMHRLEVQEDIATHLSLYSNDEELLGKSSEEGSSSTQRTNLMSSTCETNGGKTGSILTVVNSKSSEAANSQTPGQKDLLRPNKSKIVLVHVGKPPHGASATRCTSDEDIPDTQRQATTCAEVEASRLTKSVTKLIQAVSPVAVKTNSVASKPRACGKSADKTEAPAPHTLTVGESVTQVMANPTVAYTVGDSPVLISTKPPTITPVKLIRGMPLQKTSPATFVTVSAPQKISALASPQSQPATQSSTIAVQTSLSNPESTNSDSSPAGNKVPQMTGIFTGVQQGVSPAITSLSTHLQIQGGVIMHKAKAAQPAVAATAPRQVPIASLKSPAQVPSAKGLFTAKIITTSGLQPSASSHSMPNVIVPPVTGQSALTSPRMISPPLRVISHSMPPAAAAAKPRGFAPGKVLNQPESQQAVTFPPVIRSMQSHINPVPVQIKHQTVVRHPSRVIANSAKTPQPPLQSHVIRTLESPSTADHGKAKQLKFPNTEDGDKAKQAHTIMIAAPSVLNIQKSTATVNQTHVERQLADQQATPKILGPNKTLHVGSVVPPPSGSASAYVEQATPPQPVTMITPPAEVEPLILQPPTNPIMITLEDGSTAMLDPESLAQLLSPSDSVPLSSATVSTAPSVEVSEPGSITVNMADIQPGQEIHTGEILWEGFPNLSDNTGHYTFLKDKGAIMSALTKGNFQPDRKRLKTTGPRN